MKTDQTHLNEDSLRAENITFIDLRLDWAFRYVFGEPGNEDLLLKLIRAILPDLNVTGVDLSGQVKSSWSRESRSAVFDVCCRTKEEEDIVIEMQYRYEDDFSDRVLFYSTYPINAGVLKGSHSFHMKPLYVIGITNFVLPGKEGNPEMINYYSLKNRDNSGEEFSPTLHFVTVELPKLTKTLEELSTDADYMFYAIKHMGGMKEIPAKYVGGGLEKLFEMSKFAAMIETNQMRYIREALDEITRRSERRSAIELAQREGRAAGMEQGLAEGRAEGEALARLETARNFKKLGASKDMIVKATGLSEEEVEAL